MAWGYRRRSTSLMRSWSDASVSVGRTATASWARIGPWSTCSVATCTVHPVTLTPAARASRTAWAPGKAGSSEGWVFTTRPAKALNIGAASTVMKPAIATSSMPAPSSSATTCSV